MGWARGTQGAGEVYEGFQWVDLKESYHLEDLGGDGSKIRVKMVVQERVQGCCVLCYALDLSAQDRNKWRVGINPLAPNDVYISRTAQLTSRRFILNIYPKKHTY